MDFTVPSNTLNRANNARSFKEWDGGDTLVIYRFEIRKVATKGEKRKEKMENKEVLEAYRKHESEAIRIIADAFNEGFMMGESYAKQLYNKESD